MSDPMAVSRRLVAVFAADPLGGQVSLIIRKFRQPCHDPFGVRLGHSAMLAQFPVCPKADAAQRFMRYAPLG
jgi:hypothetical protein